MCEPIRPRYHHYTMPSGLTRHRSRDDILSSREHTRPCHTGTFWPLQRVLYTTSLYRQATSLSPAARASHLTRVTGLCCFMYQLEAFERRHTLHALGPHLNLNSRSGSTIIISRPQLRLKSDLRGDCAQPAFWLCIAVCNVQGSFVASSCRHRPPALPSDRPEFAPHQPVQHISRHTVSHSQMPGCLK